jgi:hypothetical protein
MMIVAWVTGSVLILKANFMPPSNGNLSKNEEKLEEEGREGARTKRKESRDSTDGRSYGNGTSMVLGEGSKTCW